MTPGIEWQGMLTIAVVLGTLGLLLWERFTPDRVMIGAVAVLALAAQFAGRWPLLALAIGSAAAAVESAALWGFLAQAEERHHSLVLVVLERLFAVVGTVLACAAVIATMLALLGRPWVL